MAAVVSFLATGCGGSLGHRSYAVLDGGEVIPPSVRRVRIEVENGSIGVKPQAAEAGAKITWKGGVRRAADTAEMLAELERVPTEFTILADPADASVLVVRGPALPQGGIPDIALRSILGVEATLWLPAELPIDLNVTGSGHLAIDGRHAEVVASTGRGDLRLTACRGPARLRCAGSGMTIVDEHCGDLDVNVNLGAMQVFVREPGDHIRLVTRQGDIQCYVPPTASFQVEGRAEIGKVGNGFGLEMRKVGDYGALLSGGRGDGRTKIALRTGSGHLSLNHKVFEQAR